MLNTGFYLLTYLLIIHFLKKPHSFLRKAYPVRRGLFFLIKTTGFEEDLAFGEAEAAPLYLFIYLKHPSNFFLYLSIYLFTYLSIQ